MKHPIRAGSARRRRLLGLTLALCLSFAAFGTLGAGAETADEITFPAGAVETPVLLDGTEILEGESFRLDGVTYVPLRNFSNLFHSPEISWNGATNTATVRTDGLTLYAQTGSYYICANDRYLYTVGRILNLEGHLYVPIRPMARAFALDLTWDAVRNRVELRSTGETAIAGASYDADEVYWLSRIISAESRGEPFLGQMAVGNVVLNRMNSGMYPDTIYGVIFDMENGVQFTPVANGSIYDDPTESAVIAAKICLEGYSLSETILFFMNPRIATSSWISENRPYAFTIANHDFYE